MENVNLDKRSNVGSPLAELDTPDSDSVHSTSEHTLKGNDKAGHDESSLECVLR